jgi:hypothetical protein
MDQVDQLIHTIQIEFAVRSVIRDLTLFHKLLAIISILACAVLSGTYILTQQWYLYSNAILVTMIPNSTWLVACVATNFMIGMWLMTLYAIGIGVVIGYVYGKTSK